MSQLPGNKKALITIQIQHEKKNHIQNNSAHTHTQKTHTLATHPPADRRRGSAGATSSDRILYIFCIHKYDHVTTTFQRRRRRVHTIISNELCSFRRRSSSWSFLCCILLSRIMRSCLNQPCTSLIVPGRRRRIWYASLCAMCAMRARSSTASQAATMMS